MKPQNYRSGLFALLLTTALVSPSFAMIFRRQLQYLPQNLPRRKKPLDHCSRGLRSIVFIIKRFVKMVIATMPLKHWSKGPQIRRSKQKIGPNLCGLQASFSGKVVSWTRL